MFTLIDNFLNKITMYRLTLYGVIAIWICGLVLSLLGILPYHFLDYIFSILVIFLACLFINRVFAYLFRAPSNVESVYITAFILALIISPKNPLGQMSFLLASCFFAIASKYLLAIRKKHIFNPAAFGVAASAFLLNQYASWWIGTLAMAPVVFICGFLITRKIQRADLVISFLAVSFLLVFGFSFFYHQNTSLLLKQIVIDSPWMFLAFIMLTEPMTTPPKKNLRTVYGTLVGVLFTPFVHFWGFFFSPELALLAGNIFSYAVSPKEKLILTLKEKIKIANNTFDFIFQPNKKLKFAPGQYMEWTLDHKSQDDRGMRRYFTIASSPTEEDVRIGVKFYDKPSSYKKTMDAMDMQSKIVASQLAGDFTLPADKNQKLVFLAGGIGVTPFRSMMKYFLDTNEKRDVVIFYANKSFSDVAYKEIFDEASQKLGIKIIHVLESDKDVPEDFVYEKGFLTKEIVRKNVSDFDQRIFYISGPRSMIVTFDKALEDMGVPKNHIKTDFFPGFA